MWVWVTGNCAVIFAKAGEMSIIESAGGLRTAHVQKLPVR